MLLQLVLFDKAVSKKLLFSSSFATCCLCIQTQVQSSSFRLEKVWFFWWGMLRAICMSCSRKIKIKTGKGRNVGLCYIGVAINPR